jgi:hypothetical protein
LGNSWEGHPTSAIREGQYILIGLKHVVAVLKVGHWKANITYYSKTKTNQVEGH